MDEDLANVVVLILLRAVLVKHLLNVVHVLVLAAKQIAVLVIVVVGLHAGKLVRHIVTVLLSAADGNAWDSAKHDGKADECDVDEVV